MVYISTRTFLLSTNRMKICRKYLLIGVKLLLKN
nr:MAG TPA: hypothetical protein [Caudoviricetes sp.]